MLHGMNHQRGHRPAAEPLFKLVPEGNHPDNILPENPGIPDIPDSKASGMIGSTVRLAMDSILCQHRLDDSHCPLQIFHGDIERRE